MNERSYPALYQDDQGVEAVTLRNDGKALRVTVRGVEFRGVDFDALEPVAGVEAAERAGFCLSQGALCACELEFTMTLPVETPGATRVCELRVALTFGRPASDGALEREELLLELRFEGRKLRSSGKDGWFEDALLGLQRQLPEGAYLRACIGCAYSDYNPAGHGLFGGLACFRDNKAAYRAVRDKRSLFAIWDTMTEYVQETHLCPEFERRTPGAGYRG
ncbi:MAG TPA: DUF6304 family protein [Polyangiaceae bacterium]|nr:DUF6304 family protein [Polyangiaceae bacterium]